METNYNFQDIWKQKETIAPDSQSIIKKANNYKRKRLLIDIRMLACMLATAAGIIVIWNLIDFQMFTTRLGIILILIAIGMYAYLFTQNINVISKINPSTSNQEYLSAIKKLEKQQIYMQTRGISIYYILLGVGFVFYFYEFALRMSLLGVVLSYGLTFFWMAVTWFFIRPKQVRKQKEKIADVINSLESLEKGFEE
ncbi:hypothetical protein [Epilithonimonas sp.]|uniref:hypothetical protein n=1 Tax=Epilithonimonas sp. TaxID=2894511 RepID=UPI0028A20B99|nr:hypothetical protein [Epilithonimonas sp.]